MVLQYFSVAVGKTAVTLSVHSLTLNMESRSGSGPGESGLC